MDQPGTMPLDAGGICGVLFAGSKLLCLYRCGESHRIALVLVADRQIVVK